MDIKSLITFIALPDGGQGTIHHLSQISLCG